MVKKEPRAKGSLKKRTEFTEQDITQICELGKDKYTVNEDNLSSGTDDFLAENFGLVFNIID